MKIHEFFFIFMLKYASMFKYYFIIDVTPFYIIIHFFLGGDKISIMN